MLPNLFWKDCGTINYIKNSQGEKKDATPLKSWIKKKKDRHPTKEIQINNKHKKCSTLYCLGNSTEGGSLPKTNDDKKGRTAGCPHAKEQRWTPSSHYTKKINLK